MNNTDQAGQIVKDLRLAVINGKEQEILNIYGRAELVEWEDVHDNIFMAYEELIEQANEILHT